MATQLTSPRVNPRLRPRRPWKRIEQGRTLGKSNDRTPELSFYDISDEMLELESKVARKLADSVRNDRFSIVDRV